MIYQYLYLTEHFEQYNVSIGSVSGIHFILHPIQSLDFKNLLKQSTQNNFHSGSFDEIGLILHKLHILMGTTFSIHEI
jgi:hypothetical protein